MENQEDFYSGKHKLNCIKTQALVSPTGLMILSSQSFKGAMHDFQLYKISGLEELIFAENEKCQRFLGNSAITLADAGYQGISKKLPGATTFFMRKKGKLLDDDQKEFNKKLSRSRIIVENWFGRHKSLWAVMGSKFRLNIDNYQYFWNFCSSLTNYHISKNPLRDFEREVYLKDDDDDDVYQYDEEEEE